MLCSICIPIVEVLVHHVTPTLLNLERSFYRILRDKMKLIEAMCIPTFTIIILVTVRLVLRLHEFLLHRSHEL